MQGSRALHLAAAVALAGGFAGCHDQGPTRPMDRGELRYAITDLGTLPGGSFSQATAFAAHELVAGISDLAGGAQHAVFWSSKGVTDIGPAGVNSGAFGVNSRGQVVGLTEIGTPDPNDANICGYGTNLQCRPFTWQDGSLKLLPLLGGYNGTIGNVNSAGQVPGAAETAERLPSTCPQEAFYNRTRPRLYYKPVIWGPGANSVRELRLLPGDDVGMALWINDAGQAVGTSGTCQNTVLPPFVVGPHAVLWESNGNPVNLGNLGGAGDPSIGTGTHGISINGRGEVVGVSVLADNHTNRGFIWTRSKGMRSLEPLAGHPASAALGINDRGDVVGASGRLPVEDANAVIWPGGGDAVDLNELVAGPTTLHLLTASGIDDDGVISGFAFDTKSEQVHAFRATPVRVKGSGGR